MLDSNLDRFTVADDTRRLRLQAHQLPDRLARSSAGDRLEILAEQDQRDDGCRCLEVDMRCAGWKQLGNERRDDRIAERGACSDHHECVHIGTAMAHCCKTCPVEPEAGTELDDRGKREQEIVERLHRNDSHQPVLDRGDHHRDHAEQQQGGCEQRGDHQAPTHRQTLLFTCLPLAVGTVGIGCDAQDLIAGLCHGQLQIRW